MTKQVPAAQFISEDKKISLYCDSDTSLGLLHDFLMDVKGNIVDRMIKAQKEEEAAATKCKAEDCGSEPAQE